MVENGVFRVEIETLELSGNDPGLLSGVANTNYYVDGSDRATECCGCDKNEF